MAGIPASYRAQVCIAKIPHARYSLPVFKINIVVCLDIIHFSLLFVSVHIPMNMDHYYHKTAQAAQDQQPGTLPAPVSNLGANTARPARHPHK